MPEKIGVASLVPPGIDCMSLLSEDRTVRLRGQRRSARLLGPAQCGHPGANTALYPIAVPGEWTGWTNSYQRQSQIPCRAAAEVGGRAVGTVRADTVTITGVQAPLAELVRAADS